MRYKIYMELDRHYAGILGDGGWVSAECDELVDKEEAGTFTLAEAAGVVEHAVEVVEIRLVAA